MNWWQLLLFPLAIIYDIITRCRNWLYDIGLFKSHSFHGLYAISVGNLSVGGTGKTPMVEYLIRFGINEGWKIAILSRGYGRSTRGVLIANNKTSAEHLGDESFGYYQQFGKNVKVTVAESRVAGIVEIQKEFPDVNVVILDDAFQHRKLKTDFNILLTTYSKPFWRDFLMPSGRLREARNGFERADSLVITKCPEVVGYDVPNKIRNKQIAYSKVTMGQIKMVAGELSQSVVAVAGIAKNSDFFDYIESNFELIDALGFRDHHTFSENEIVNLIERVKKEKATLICTFKDYVKLKEFDKMNAISWGYIPIQVEFITGEDKLKETLKSKVALHVNTRLES